MGGHCLKALLESTAYEKVIVIARKNPGLTNAKLTVILSNFENLKSIAGQIKADDVFCAMGTTIAKAGSRSEFKRVDLEVPMRVAELAKQHGAKTFVLVSSLGADAGSGVFYSKTKGELENALMQLHFNALIILRPSILLGDRNEQRTGETIAKIAADKLAFLFSGPLKKYKGTPADMLGALMVKLAQQNITGTKVVENNEIFELADKL